MTRLRKAEITAITGTILSTVSGLIFDTWFMVLGCVLGCVTIVLCSIDEWRKMNRQMLKSKISAKGREKEEKYFRDNGYADVFKK